MGQSEYSSRNQRKIHHNHPSQATRAGRYVKMKLHFPTDLPPTELGYMMKKAHYIILNHLQTLPYFFLTCSPFSEHVLSGRLTAN